MQLEVTESAVMDNPERTFGILDALKIDKCFVTDVLTDSDDAEISNAIIRLAHILKLRVVAEGGETFEPVAFLKQNGRDEI